MANLDDFLGQDLQEQLAVLEEMERIKRPEDISALVELLDSETDTIVQQMILNTLRVLLEENESEAINGLSSDNEEIRKLCIAVAGMQQFDTAPAVLGNLAKVETNTKVLLEIISALSKIESEESLETFRLHMNHADPLIAAQSIQMIGSYGDAASSEKLMSLLDKANAEDLYERCEITTQKAIEALGKMGNAEVVASLVSNIHHKNPTVRRLVQEQLVKIGTRAVLPVAAHFSRNDVANKIMSAQVMGSIGGQEAAAVLVKAINKGAADHVNIKVAIYEALGKIPCQKSLACLTEALSEEDESVLMAVVSALDKQADWGSVNAIMKQLGKLNNQSERLLRVIVASKALEIFAPLFEEGQFAEKLMRTIERSHDQEVVEAFRNKLVAMGSDRALSGAERLGNIHENRRIQRILVVDDEKSAHIICRSFLSPLGFEVETAEDGQEALEILRRNGSFALLLVDMNMPVMDGIELTRKVRAHTRLQDIPIIMVSSEAEESQRVLAEKAGVDRFITKPFSQDEFQSKVQALLDQDQDKQ